jgi:preprotein translocase subunit SecA
VQPGNPEEWVNTLISHGAGVLTSGAQKLRDRYFGSFLLIERSAMRKASKKKLFAGMSAVQKAKLDQWKLDNAERIARSQLFDTMLADVPIVEPKPFIPIIPRVGRNEPCPCGSGKKYKKCHG